jgi:signal peptidase I
MDEQRRVKPYIWRYGWIASIMPGAGQFIAGNTILGVLFFIVFYISQVLGIFFILRADINASYGWSLIDVSVVVYVANIISAIWLAKRHTTVTSEEHSPASKDPYFKMLLSNFLPGVGHILHREREMGAMFLIIYIGSWLIPQSMILFFIRIFGTGLVLMDLSSKLFKSMTEEKQHSRFWIRLIFVQCCIAVLSWVLISTKVELMKIDTTWNEPSIMKGDYMLVDIKWINPPTRGSFIVYSMPPNLASPDSFFFAGRAVAFAGESIQLKNGMVYINGDQLVSGAFYRLHYKMQDILGHSTDTSVYRVPIGRIFILSDNAQKSLDSRNLGAISIDRIKGVCYKTIWPPNRVNASLISGEN